MNCKNNRYFEFLFIKHIVHIGGYRTHRGNLPIGIFTAISALEKVNTIGTRMTRIGRICTDFFGIQRKIRENSKKNP